MNTRDQFQAWMTLNAQGADLLGCGIGFANKTWICASFSERLETPALESAMRCLADTFDVAALHHVPALEHRWTFAQQIVSCARRPDKTFLAVFVENGEGTDLARVRHLIEDFKTFQPFEEPGPAETAPPTPSEL